MFSCTDTYHILFICSSDDGLLSCFYVLAVISNAGIICVLSYLLGIAGSYGDSVLLPEELPDSLKVVIPFYIPTSSI